jgi:hypothetical protein
MKRKKWTFEAGSRVPGWLIETIDCVVVFDWPAVLVEQGNGWKIYPAEPVREGSPPFLLRPSTKRHQGIATPKCSIWPSYVVRDPVP